MQIISINGSRRKKGNTARLIQSILQPLEQDEAAVTTVFLGDYTIGACTGCEGCSDSWECVIRDDFQSLVKMIDSADGIILTKD